MMTDDPSLPDMSPEAVDRRLQDLGDLYRLAQSLATARVLGPIADFPLYGDVPMVVRDSGREDQPGKKEDLAGVS